MNDGMFDLFFGLVFIPAAIIAVCGAFAKVLSFLLRRPGPFAPVPLVNPSPQWMRGWYEHQARVDHAMNQVDPRDKTPDQVRKECRRVALELKP